MTSKMVTGLVCIGSKVSAYSQPIYQAGHAKACSLCQTGHSFSWTRGFQHTFKVIECSYKTTFFSQPRENKRLSFTPSAASGRLLISLELVTTTCQWEQSPCEARLCTQGLKALAYSFSHQITMTQSQCLGQRWFFNWKTEFKLRRCSLAFQRAAKSQHLSPFGRLFRQAHRCVWRSMDV